MGFFCAYEIGILGEAVELDATVGIVGDVLGAEHPATLSSRSSLAYYALIKLLRLLMFVRGRCQSVSGCWGPEYPFTKQVKNILEMARREMNQSTASSE